MVAAIPGDYSLPHIFLDKCNSIGRDIDVVLQLGEHMSGYTKRCAPKLEIFTPAMCIRHNNSFENGKDDCCMMGIERHMI